MYIERASYRDPLPIFFKFLYCVIIKILNLKGSMQKTYLFPLQKGEPLSEVSKYIGYTDTVLFPTIGKEGDVQPPNIGCMSDIYCRKV
jgi:hypothetical protein